MKQAELCHVAYSYDGRQVLRDVSFRLEPGRITILTGAAGCGKSTVLGLLCRSLKPEAGKVRLPRRVGFVPQEDALLAYRTVAENVAFFARLFRSRAPKALPGRLEPYRDETVASLSGGLRKQLTVAIACLGTPELLLLDDPCASLDVVARQEIRTLMTEVREKGTAVLWVSHDPEEYAALADRILLLSDGVIREGAS